MNDKKRKKVFIWPNSSTKNAFFHLPVFARTETVESLLSDMFSGGYPLLCSSGRSALNLAIISSQLTRRNYVSVFPFASHCVLDAVSRNATPLCGKGESDLQLIYHQWGYVQGSQLPPNSIEDCVDSLCVPGAKLFPRGGAFEVWSLPKILASTWGGVLWCRDREMLERVKEIRNNFTSSAFQWILRLCSKNNSSFYNYWQGGECTTGNSSRLQNGEIVSAIRNWESLVKERQIKIDALWQLLAFEGLEKPVDRLPSAIPLKENINKSVIEKTGIDLVPRTMEYIDKSTNNHSLVRLQLLPIHQDVPMSLIDKIVSQKDYLLRK